MKPITKPQIKIIHFLLGDLEIMHEKQQLVKFFTNGRTESTRDMFMKEAKDMIFFLKKHEKYESAKSHIRSFAYWVGFINNNDSVVKNEAILDDFCIRRGAVKKPIDEQTLSELHRTRKQFYAILSQHKSDEERKKKEEEENAKNKVLLEELNNILEEFVADEEYEKATLVKRRIDMILGSNKPTRRKKKNAPA